MNAEEIAFALDQARREIEGRFVVGPLGNWAESCTGEPYTEVLSGGQKADGDVTPCLCASPQIAIRLWKDAVEHYARARAGTLYWRIEPEIDSIRYCLDVDENGKFVGHRDFLSVHVREGWRIYSRLLISDKPAIQAQWKERKTA